MIRRPPRSTRTDTLFPYTTLFRSNWRIVPESTETMSAFSNAQPIRRRSTLSSDSQKNLPSIPCDFSKNLAVVERKTTAIHRISAAILQFLNYNSSDERSVGKECVSTVRSRWAPYHKKTKKL